MKPTSPRSLALLALSGGTAAWLAQQRADRRRILADPEHATLNAPLEGRPLPVTTPDGVRLHAEAFGPEDAPTIVLIHGWTCELRFWTYQIQDLSKDFRVVAYDLRGHGESEGPDGADYSIETLADDLEAILQACVPQGQRPVLAGHSLGAMTLVAWAGRHPDEVRDRLAAAVLVNTGLGDLISESLVLRTPARLDGVKQVAGRILLSAKAPFPKGSTPLSHRAVQYVALSPAASPARVAFCEEIVLGCRRDVRAATGGTLSRLDLGDAVASLDVPAIVVAGERDKLTPAAHARRFAEALPQLVELTEIPEVGHMAPVEAPDAVGAAIRRLAREHLAVVRAA